MSGNLFLEDPSNLRGLYSCLFSFKMRVSEVMKLYNTTINKILKMNWLGLLESASLLALNIDFKIWFEACYVTGTVIQETGPQLKI